MNQNVRVELPTITINGRTVELSFSQEAHPELARRMKEILISEYAPKFGEKRVDAA